MKNTFQSDLVIGKLYCDSSRINGYNAVVMRYVGKKKGFHEFKYISGVNEYIMEDDEIIRFAHYKKEPNGFWELAEEQCACFDLQPL